MFPIFKPSFISSVANVLQPEFNALAIIMLSQNEILYFSLKELSQNNIYNYDNFLGEIL